MTPHYAVKCHNDPLILDALASLGIGFDCASEAEIRSVVARGVSPDKIVYTNPCKPDNQVLASKDLGVALTVFDNANELEKIKRVYPETKLLLRIMGDDSFSICQFNSKFGASHTEYAPLLAKARELGLDVVGVSFHVGSGCTSAAPFGDAIGRAKRCFELAKTYGFEMTVLDLGGGFPGDKMAQVSFEAIAVNINEALDAHFPAGPATDNLRIIAEPGRYFVSSCSTLASRIIAKRVVPAADEKGKTALMYYQNEGVYAAFNCVLYDHQEVFAHPLKDPKDVTSEHNCQVRSQPLSGKPVAVSRWANPFYRLYYPHSPCKKGVLHRGWREHDLIRKPGLFAVLLPCCSGVGPVVRLDGPRAQGLPAPGHGGRRLAVRVTSGSISPPWGSNPISSGSPHVRCTPMWALSTCGA